MDVAYYRAREQAHREAALVADDPAIAAIHRDLADRYEALVRSLCGHTAPAVENGEPPVAGN